MLSVYTLENCDKWDSIVKSFEKYEVYYLSGYVKAFKLHGDGEPMLFYYEKNLDGKNIRGINVVMKRDISKCEYFSELDENTFFDIATPYGYGGWLVEGNAELYDEMFVAYEQYCRENNIISEFVRFHPMNQNQEGLENYYDVIPLGETVALDLENEDIIWENITSKNRNVIRKAIKNNVVIEKTSSSEIYDTFMDIYNKTMDKDNAESYYYFNRDFYTSIQKDLPDNSTVFYAKYDDKIIAASIMIYANGRINYHLSGSVREYQNLAPTNLLLYETALWGRKNGYKSLYLGGGVGSGEDSLFKFKRAFYRGDLHRFHIGKKIFLQDEYDKLVKMRKNLPESGFFPRYRA